MNESTPVIAALILGFVIGVFFVKFGIIGKYEGHTAEQWFDEYDVASSEGESCMNNLDICQSSLSEYEEAGGNSLLNFGQCASSSKEFYRGVIQKCMSDKQFTEAQCIKAALQVASIYRESVIKCTDKFFE